MKKCCTCKCELPLEMFHRNRSKYDGLYSSCKKCNKEYNKKNKDRAKLQNHLRYLKNKKQIIERSSEYAAKNKDKCSAWAKKTRNKLKHEVFSYYCQGDPKCYCGETDLSLLVIDHINGGGNKHRREIGVSGGYVFYQWIKKNNFPDEFQVLCYNCNFKKKNQECKSKNPTKRQQQSVCRHKLLKQTCFEHYGSICLCGEKDIDVLTLDHINDDGSKHRKVTGLKGGASFYSQLRMNNFPNDPPLQVLCMNCQIKKKNKAYEKKKHMKAKNI